MFMRSTEFLQKYRKLIRFLRILSQIGCWLSAVAVLVFLPAAIYLSVRGGGNLTYALPPGFRLGYIDGVISYNLALAAGTVAPPRMTGILIQIFFSSAVCSAVFGAILLYLSGVLGMVEKGLPFDRGNARRIASIGFIFLVGSVMVGTAQASVANIIVHALNLTDLVSVNYTANTTMLSTGLLMLILSGVFRYGSYLQEEYDATL
jgi:hypothetical protein